jgi:biopolymer transport protein ExbB
MSLGALKLLSAGGLIIIFILILSIIALAIIIERFFYYKKIKSKMDEMYKSLRNALIQKEYDKVEGLLKSNRKLPLSKILSNAISSASYLNIDELKEAVEDEGYRQSYYLKKRLLTLSTIGTISPLLGLLGTVFGMIKSFMVIASTGGNPEALAGGISEALLTTAAGLVVAIPVIIFYNILANKNKLLTIDIEEKMGRLMRYLKGIKLKV